MPFDPRAVANRLLELGRERQLTIDPMKVQKLIYYAHGWHLALTGKPLLDRSVEAWQYGPVLPDVYRAFQQLRRTAHHRARALLQHRWQQAGAAAL